MPRFLPAWIESSAGKQIIGATVLVVAVISLISGWYNVEAQRDTLMQKIEQQGRLLAHTTAILAAEPLLTLDYPSLDTFVQGLTVQEDRALYAWIEREDGRTVAQAGDPEADHGPWTSEYWATIHAPTIDPRESVGRPLGRAVLGISWEQAAQTVDRSRRRLILQALATFVLLALTLSWILERLVNRPLQVLATQARRLGAGDLDREIRLDKRDEFGHLATTLESMREGLASSYREIQRQNERLRELDQLKSTFLATMSHEIRTPMNGVLGFSKLLQETDLDDEQQAMAKTLASSARSLLTIVNDILDLSKIEAGQIRLESIDFDLADVVAEVAHLLTPDAANKGLRLITEIDERIPETLVGDPLRIRQIVTNLVNNAIKFTERGRIVVRALLRDTRAASATFRLEIEDTGIGVDDATKAKLFQAFTQADASTTRKYGGTGLGLAISKSLVELMGGSIGVDSVPGEGSTFWATISLPRSHRAVAETSVRDVAGSRILVVDPNESALRATRLLLDSWNVRSIGARNVADAVQCARVASNEGQRPIDAVLVDAAIVLDDDPRLLERLRAADPHRRLPVVLCLPSTVSVSNWERLGLQAVLHKPLRASQLYDTLAEVLQQAPPVAEPTALTAPVAPRRRPGDPAPRILLVEDNAVNQKLAVRVLVRAGYEVDVVHNGREAVDVVQGDATRYDAILMDCQMPVMDGYTATQEIRARGGPLTTIPIIAMTAHAMKGDREKCIAAGMDDYVTKPIDFAGLRRVVAHWAGEPPESAGPEPVQPAHPTDPASFSYGQPESKGRGSAKTRG